MLLVDKDRISVFFLREKEPGEGVTSSLLPGSVRTGTLLDSPLLGAMEPPAFAEGRCVEE